MSSIVSLRLSVTTRISDGSSFPQQRYFAWERHISESFFWAGADSANAPGREETAAEDHLASP